MSNNNSLDGGGPPPGTNTNTGIPPPHIFEKLPKQAQVDLLFTPSFLVEFLIFIFFAIYFIPPLIFYIKYRHHVIIRYRQPLSVIISGILCTVNSLLVPVIKTK